MVITNLVIVLGWSNSKVIRNKDIIFNESILYKGSFEIDSKDSSPEVKKPEMVPLKDLPMIELENINGEIDKT